LLCPSVGAGATLPLEGVGAPLVAPLVVLVVPLVLMAPELAGDPLVMTPELDSDPLVESLPPVAPAAAPLWLPVDPPTVEPLAAEASLAPPSPSSTPPSPVTSENCT
jgi:hypothetical protein